MIIPLTLNLRSNPARYGVAGAARLINAYAEQIGAEGKTPHAVWGVDGFTLFSTPPNDAKVRAMLAVSDTELLVVAGRLLYRIDPSGTSTLVGGIASDGLTTMARNRAAPNPQVAIVSGGIYYGYQGGLVSKLSDPDLPPPVSVAALNGYFSFFLADGRHFSSGIDDFGVEALDFATAEANPDGGLRNFVRGQDLLFFGPRSTEFWRDVGGDPYPFARTTVKDYGLLAADSVADVDQTTVFVAHDGTVRILNGYDAERISTHAVERAIADDTSPADIEACSWQSRGHTFYAISGATFSWVWDRTTGFWHERKSYGLDRWRISKAVQYGSRIVVGDYANSKLYTMSETAYDENGDPLVMQVQFAPTHAFPYRLAFNSLYVDAVPGVGLVSGTDHIANPAMMIDYSDDGGKTWSTQRTEPLGAASQDLVRVKTTRLGASANRTFRIGISAAVARGIMGANVDVQKLRA